LIASSFIIFLFSLLNILAMSSNGQKMDKVTPIAVVGMSFRGPGDATNTEGLLQMVAEGRESRAEIPKQKWNHEGFYHPDPSRHGTVSRKPRMMITPITGTDLEKKQSTM
jgi:acyl transferase domain-containing protein